MAVEQTAVRLRQTHDDDGRPSWILGDHIVELKDGGAPLDAANVQLLCMACHQQKTAEVSRKRKQIQSGMAYAKKEMPPRG